MMIYYNKEFHNHQSKIPYAKGLAFKIDELPFNISYYDVLKRLGEKYVVICNGEPMITNMGLLKLFNRIPKMKIAICGIKNSGKNKVANLLQSKHEKFQILSFHDELKRLTKQVFDYATDDEKYEQLRADMYQFISSNDNELILNNVVKQYNDSMSLGNDIIVCGIKTQRQYEFVKTEQFKLIYVEATEEHEQDTFDDYIVHSLRQQANYIFKCDYTMSNEEQTAAKNRLIEYAFRDIDLENLLK